MSKENPRKELSPGSKYNRYFSESFKREKVKLVLKNQLSVTQLSRLCGVTRASIYKWIYKYSDLEKGHKMVVQMESEEFKTKRLQEKVAELERAI
ncbi:MAG: transposase, partial [Saprospiraceae bacterium]|nr:transposase [Saprospiraceae bacterium]